MEVDSGLKHSITGSPVSEEALLELREGSASALQEIRLLFDVGSVADEVVVSRGLIRESFLKRLFRGLSAKSQNGLLAPSKFSGTGITASNDSISVVEIISVSELFSELFAANFLCVLLAPFPLLGAGTRLAPVGLAFGLGFDLFTSFVTLPFKE